MKLDFEKTAKEILSVFLKDVSSYGGIGFYVVAILAFGLLNDAAYFLGLIISLLAVTAVVAAVRLSHFKPRPGAKKHAYRTYYERIDNSSFPSIHAARSAMMSIALWAKLPELAWLFIFITFMVCVSRIYFRRHDYVDIIAGLLIGLALGYMFFLL